MKFIGNYKNSTPIRLMLVATICVFIAESIIMIGLSVLTELSTLLTIIIDSTLIVLFVLPVLFYLFFRPLQKSLQEKIESEKKFKLLADHTIDWEYFIDVSGEYLYLSVSCEQITGYTQEEFLKNPSLLFDIVSPEHRSRISNHYKFANNEDAPPHTTEFSITHKNGEKRWLEHNCLSVFDDDGKYLGRRGNNRDITNRKFTDEALRESEQKHRLIFETASYLITSVDTRGNLVDCNNKIFEMLGYTRDEIIGQSMTKIIHPDFHKAAFNTIKKLVTTGLANNQIYKMIRKDGVIIDVNISSSSVKDAQGKYQRSICIIDDITERKQTEEKLRASEVKFHGMIQNLMEGFSSVTIDGKLLDYNNEFIRLLAMDSQKDHTGLIVKEFWQNQEDRVEYIEKILKYGSLKNYIVYAKRSDGKKIIVQTNPRLIYDENGTPERIEGTFLDITDKMKAEETNALLSRAIEQANETIVITDADGIIQYVNPAFEKTSGYSSEDAIGQNPSVLKSGKHDDAFYRKMWDVLSNGKQWQGELINKKKDGSLFIENTTISPVLDSNGKIINYVAAKNDITETKRLQKLESRAERLEMAGTIAGQVAHDFNNLLAPIMAYPEFIRDELPHDSIAQAYLDTIETAAKKIADINQDLLTMGRRGHYNQEIININSIVLQAVKEMKARTKIVTCETSLDEKIMNIKGGAAQIHRMLINLFVNAYDAMDDIGMITIKTENYYADDTSMAFGRVPKGEYVKLTVTDNGCGIPDDIIQKILDPFFSTKVADKKSGSGLGLSVVDAVMKDHNGYLDLSSKVGKGTSFYLYFPITREESESSASTQLRCGTEKILIVDDDDVQREVTEQLLKKLNYKISSVSSGEKAVEFLKENQQDLVILDMMMPPGIDGTETYRQILEINANQKAIIVSGFSESDRVFEAQDLGVGAFVRKPFTKSTISAAVRTELERDVKITTLSS